MKYLAYALIVIVIGFSAFQVGAQVVRVFTSEQIGTNPTDGYCLTTNGATSTWSPCSGGSGGASSTIIQIDDTTVNAGVPTLDFGTGFTITESPTDEFNISIPTTSASLEDFGANSTDGSDDLAAIQAAMNWSNTVNGRVTCSPGTYLISAPLTIATSSDFLYLDFSPDCRIQRTFSSTGINGMVVNGDTAGAADGTTRPSNITIKGGDWGSAYTAAGDGTASAVTYTGNIFSFIADSILLDSVHMNGLGSSGRFFLGGGENFRILRPVWKHAEVDAGTGGARILAGSGLVADGEIISGDDSLAAVPGETGDFGDLSLGHVVFRDMRGTSTAARFFAVGLTNQTAGSQATFTASIGRVDCVRCSGTGALYPAIITAVDTTGQIGEVNIIDSELTDGSATDGSLLYAILVDGGTGLSRGGNMGIGTVRVLRTNIYNTHGTAFQQIGEVGTIELDGLTADTPREAGAAAVIARQAQRMIARNVDVTPFAGENGYQIGTNTTGEEVQRFEVDGGVVRNVYHRGASTVRYGFNLVKTNSSVFINRPRVEVASSSIYVRYLGLSANTYNTNVVSADMREILAATPIQDLAEGTRFGRDIITATSTYRDASVLTATEGGTGTSTYSTGDFLYASAANTLSRLTIGSTGQVLMVSGGIPTWTSTSSLGITVSTSTLASQHLVTNEYDVYTIAGQSNAVATAGVQASSTYAVPGTAKSYYQGTIQDVSNDVNPGDGGPWPGFAAQYYKLTGRKIAFVHTALGGTGLNATSSGASTTLSWGPEGTLHATSVAQTNDAMNAFRSAGLVPIYKGVLWSQGEQDATYINALDETAAQYRTSLESVISRYRTAFGTTTPFYIFRTGTHLVASDSGYGQVRQEQENVVATDPHTYMAFRSALDFRRRGMMSDNVHYDQAGYNEMGRVGAEGVVMSRTEPHWYSVSNALIYNPFASSSGPLFIGDFGVATSTWASTTFEINLGDTRLFDALGDSTGATGTNGQVLSSTGTSTLWTTNVASGGLGTTSIDTSAELAAILTDETGTAGASVFSVSPTLTGTTSLQTVNFGFATSSINSAAAAASSTHFVIYDPTNSNAWSTSNPWGLVRWRTGDAGFPSKSHWAIGPVMDTVNGNNSNFAFYSDVNDSGLIERMRMTLDGKLLIGTSSSLARLTVQSLSGAVDAFAVYTSGGTKVLSTVNNAGATTTVSGGFKVEGALGDSVNSVGSLGMLLQSTGTSTRWVATSTLGLGAGGSASGTVNTGNTGQVAFYNATGTAVSGTSSLRIGADNWTYAGTGLTVGDTTYSRQTYGFTVVGTNNTTGVGDLGLLGSVNLSTTTNSTIGFQHAQQANGGAVQITAGFDFIANSTTNGAQSASIAWATRNAGSYGERMRLTYDGKFGIGTTSPTSPLSVTGAAHITGTTTVGGLSIGSLSGFLKSIAGAVVTALVNLATDVTGVLPIANGGTGTTTPKIWSTTLASTSQAFIDGGLVPAPDLGGAYTITRIHCQVIGGTSKVIAIEDASGNSTEDITCGTSDSFDDGSITNASYTAWEDSFIDFGATSGAVNYVKITVFGN